MVSCRARQAQHTYTRHRIHVEKSFSKKTREKKNEKKNVAKKSKNIRRKLEGKPKLGREILRGWGNMDTQTRTKCTRSWNHLRPKGTPRTNGKWVESSLVPRVLGAETTGSSRVPQGTIGMEMYYDWVLACWDPVETDTPDDLARIHMSTIPFMYEYKYYMMHTSTYVNVVPDKISSRQYSSPL